MKMKSNNNNSKLKQYKDKYKEQYNELLKDNLKLNTLNDNLKSELFKAKSEINALKSNKAIEDKEHIYRLDQTLRLAFTCSQLNRENIKYVKGIERIFEEVYKSDHIEKDYILNELRKLLNDN